MPDCLNVHLLPSCVTPEGLAGRCALVIDVLRATTTIVQALAAGARCVYPTLEIADARQRAAELPPGSALLAGERGGLKIEGFDLGNSPREFTPAAVAGRAICFTTTNGTRALLHAAAARRILPAALVNRSALARAVAQERQIEIVCAGTRGEVSREDVLTAGALAELLPGRTLNDSAHLALAAWRECVRPLGDGTSRTLAGELARCQGGRDLLEVGLGDDLPWAARLDALSVVAEFDPQTGAITSRAAQGAAT